mmetsp:Transcript_10924/g.33245  ORF Transcript_10924/g.33245 Transcript_10924/m.33245 type:complete len:260 (+) Transcript_10924:557-1336(+)
MQQKLQHRRRRCRVVYREHHARALSLKHHNAQRRLCDAATVTPVRIRLREGAMDALCCEHRVSVHAAHAEGLGREGAKSETRLGAQVHRRPRFALGLRCVVRELVCTAIMQEPTGAAGAKRNAEVGNANPSFHRLQHDVAVRRLGLAHEAQALDGHNVVAFAAVAGAHREHEEGHVGKPVLALVLAALRGLSYGKVGPRRLRDFDLVKALPEPFLRRDDVQLIRCEPAPVRLAHVNLLEVAEEVAVGHPEGAVVRVRVG